MPNVVADQMCFLQGDDGKIFLNKKNRRICNYLRIKRLFGLLENWVTR